MKFAIAIALALAIAAASSFITASPFIAASSFIVASPFMRWVWGKIWHDVESARVWPFIIWVWGITCALVNAVKAGYLFHYDDNIQKVRVEAEKLGHLKEKVDTLFQRIGDVAEDGVQTWLDDVDVAEDGVKNLMEDKAKVDESCLGGWCHCISRYQLSQKAKQKTDEITALHEKGNNFKILSHPALPPQIEASSGKDFRTFKTRASVTAEIMDALKDDNAHFIGICGMGGVGKTTLVMEIGRRVKQTGLFSDVVMAVVSETPIVTKIQKEIADMLGHQLDDNASESNRARKLWETIKARKKPVLVILDDVWGNLDLGAVGIPYGNDHKDCKVVLTSRSRDVCNRMRVQKIVPVDELDKQDAWVLFREMAGGEAVDSSDLNQIAREVADECGGVPLVIVTIATGLQNKNQRVWAARARQLKNSNLQHGILEKKVIAKLELSFNYLERKDSKLLFLLCSLFPEYRNISVEDLMRYAMGLKLFGDVNTIEEARERTYDAVSTLTDSFMLLDGSEKGFVKMHDILRDVAISNLNERHGFKVMAGLKNWPDTQTFENYSAISLISNHFNELPRELSAPKLQTLRMQCNSHLQIPDDFFKGSKNQLIFLEMSGIHFLPILPPSLQLLSTSLRTLHLTSCKLRNISMIGKLHNLEILSFCGSEIVEIPSDIAELTRLKLLDLTRCKNLENIAADISKLPALEELYLPQYYFKFANLVGLNSSSRLTRLQILIPIHHLIPVDQDLLPTDLIQLAQKLTSFNITIHRTEETGVMRKYRFRYREYNPNPYECKGTLIIRHEGPIQPLLSDWVKLLLEKSQHLVLRHLKNLNSIFSELSKEGFNELKSLELDCLEGTEYLVNTKESTPQMAFSSLEFLSISNMWSFIEICPGQLPDNSFRNVRELNVMGCNNILKLVSSSLLVRLKNLEKLRVMFCGRLVHVFEELFCGRLVHVFEEHVVEEVSLSKLKEIELVSLNNMTYIWKDGPHQCFSFCNLEKLRVCLCTELTKLFSPKLLQGLVRLKYLDVSYCDSLEVLFGHDEEQDTEIAVPFLRSLTRVSVYHCENLRCLFSTSIGKGDLEKLQYLEVFECNKLQTIIEDKKGKQEATLVEFPCLSSIWLTHLYNLESFCTGLYTIKWPSLEWLSIGYCFKMKTFGYGNQETPELKKIVKRESKGAEIAINGGNLNHVVQNHFGPEASTSEAGPSHPSP